MEPVIYNEFLLNIYIFDLNGFGTTVYKLVAQQWYYSMMDCNLAATLQQFDTMWGEAKGYVTICSEHDLTQNYWELLSRQATE